MAVANLTIAGRRYEMACREGEQAHLQSLGAMIDAKAREAGTAVGGGLSETRQLLLAALLLADELNDAAPSRPGEAAEIAESGPGQDTTAQAAAIEVLALRLESLAARLEKAVGQP